MRLLIALSLLHSLLPSLLSAQTPDKPLRSVTDPGVITTRQAITPAGIPTVFDGRVHGVQFGTDSNEIWVLNAQRLYKLNWRENKILENIPTGGAPGLQAIAFDAETKRPYIGLTARGGQGGDVQFSTIDGSKLAAQSSGLGKFIAGSPAIAAKPNAKGQRLALLPLTFNNKLAVMNLGQSGHLGLIPTGIAPYAAVIASDGSSAWVSNWGGRLPKSGDLTAATGLDKTADQVVVDARGVASTGSITRIDLSTMSPVAQIPVQLQPTALALDETRKRLYVANSNSDTISVVDTTKNTVLTHISLRPFAIKALGVAPLALALSSNGQTLYVACAGINAILVLDPLTGAQRGMIPTAWYPNSLSLSSDGKRLAVGALLGAGSGWREAPNKRFVHTNRGAVAVIEVPDAAELANFTTAVLENNHQQSPTAVAAMAPRPNPAAKPKAIPARSSEPSLIEHVVYIVKENRTYDQVFGDLGKGNSDPSMVMFGEDVTPNHHALARDFVTLDNLYATGGNSGNGHQWVTQASETPYTLWPGYAGRSYPFDGSDPIAIASGGMIWDYALARKKTVRIFGEYAGRQAEPNAQRHALMAEWQKGADFSSRWNTVAPIANLNQILAKNYPAYTNAIPDVVRAQIFLGELKKWEGEGKMPNLTIIQLPCDHTSGTSPGANTPRAMVADNDLALGKIVEGLSKSPFWNKMAIFVVEDDAQNGVDHVDGHRTVALAVSPYTKRGHVDSTFYAHQSILKTIELILGLPTMSLFDLIANDMRNSFTDTPDAAPYTSLVPKQSLTEMNPQSRALRGEARKAALASAKMRWDVPDAVPSNELNRILWHSIKGWSTPYPEMKQSVFAPFSLEADEEDEEEQPRKKR